MALREGLPGHWGVKLSLVADGMAALAIWATPLDAAKLTGIAEFFGAESQLAAGSAAPTEAELANLPGQRLPNMVWVTIDTLRGDRLGAYDREIRFVDRHMDLMLADLRERGLHTEGDYLNVTSGHGEELYDHQQGLHGRSLYEEMVLGPGIEAGKGIDTPVNLVDLLQTIAGMTGREAPFPHPGRGPVPAPDQSRDGAQRPRLRGRRRAARGRAINPRERSNSRLPVDSCIRG
jgi:hypothetical protein